MIMISLLGLGLTGWVVYALMKPHHFYCIVMLRVAWAADVCPRITLVFLEWDKNANPFDKIQPVTLALCILETMVTIVVIIRVVV